MTDFETHPAGTAALLAELQAAQKYRYIGKDGKPVLARDLEDRIEQLEAKLTRANAATAAAYEVAAREVECGCGAGPCQDTANCAAKDAAAIRALATPDQRSALDRLIADAEARVWDKAAEIAAKSLERAPDNECASGWTVSTARLNAIRLQAGEWAEGAYLETVERIALVVEKGCADAIRSAASKKGGA